MRSCRAPEVWTERVGINGNGIGQPLTAGPMLCGAERCRIAIISVLGRDRHMDRGYAGEVGVVFSLDVVHEAHGGLCEAPNP